MSCSGFLPRAMRSLFLALSFLAFGLFHASSVLAACAESGGNELCSKGSPSAWQYGIYNMAERGASQLWCEVVGGTWDPSVWPPCLNPGPVTESNYLAIGLEAERRGWRHVCQVTQRVLGPWSSGPVAAEDCSPSGINTTLGVVWHQKQPVYYDGVYWDDCSRTFEHALCAARDRQVFCPQGYTVSGQGPYCVKALADACPVVGNPVRPLVGEKLHSEAVLENTAFNFDLHYSSHGYFKPTFASAEVEVGLGDFWSHTYSSRLYLYSAASFPASTVSAIAVRPDLTLVQFGLDGVEIGARSGAKHRLERIMSAGAITGYRLILGNDDIEEYDSSGFLVRISYVSGKTVDLTYETIASKRLLVRATDEKGRVLSLSYDSRGVLSEASFGGSRIARFTFDSYKRLSLLERGVYGPRRFEYGDTRFPYALTGIIDEEGNPYATYEYNADGYVSREVHAGGVDERQFIYAAGSVEIREQGLDPQIMRYQSVNGMRKVTEESQGCASCGSGSTQSKTYDTSGQLDRATDFRGIVTDYDFNARGLATRTQEVANSSCPSTMPDCLSSRRTVETSWHSSLNKPIETRIRNAAGDLVGISKQSYNARGQVTATCQVDPNLPAAQSYVCGASANAPAGVSQTQIAYCEASDVAREASDCPILGLVKSIDGALTEVADAIQYRYYASTDLSGCDAASGACHQLGDLREVIAPLGLSTQYLKYDRAGRITQIRDAKGTLTELAYNTRGDLVSHIVRGPDSASEVDDAITTMAYDLIGQIIRVTEADGSYLGYTYNMAQRLTGVRDNQGNSLTYVLDNQGNATKETIRDPSNTLKQVLARQYDRLNRLKAEVRAPYANQIDLDAEGIKKTQYQYDGNNNPIATIDAEGIASERRFDPLNRITQSIEDRVGLNTITRYRYDVKDNLTEVIDPNGLSTQYRYDYQNNLVEIQSPDTGTTTTTYDPAGNPLTQTDARGITASYRYDALNRITQIRYPDLSLTTNFQYDTASTDCPTQERYSQGELSQMQDQPGTTSWCYDRKGNPTRKVQRIINPGAGGEGGAGPETVLTTRYTYTTSDQLREMTYPSGFTVQYQRDALGQINQVSIRDGSTTIPLVTNISYEPFGPPRQLSFANGRTVAKGYDQNYDLTQIRGIALNLDLTRNNLGNIAEQATATQARSYRYDHLNRLEQVHDGSKVLQERYQYDPTGNRTERYKTNGSAVTTTRYAYASASHHLVAQTSGATVTARTYDAIGNTLTNGAATYSYDQQNRFSQYQQGNITETYRHNGQGQRISKTTSQRTLTSDGAVASAQTVYFIYDEQGQLIGEYTSSGQRIREYIYLGTMPVATIDQAGNLAYIETDHLATPRTLIDPARNQTIWTWDSLATTFGEHKPQQDPDRDGISTVFNLRYPGQYYDEATKLHYNGFRTYDPSIGRYTQSDPIGLYGGINTYLYTEGNPINKFDFQGLNSLTACANPVNAAVCAEAGILPSAANSSPGVKIISTATGASILCIFTGNCSVNNSDVPKPPIPENPEDCPGEDWEWRGKKPIGGNKGAWHNPNTGESLHPDLGHAPPIGGHWDYTDAQGRGWRIFPDGTVQPKE